MMEEHELNPYEASISPQTESETVGKEKRHSTFFVMPLIMMVLGLPAVILVQRDLKVIFEDFELELPILTQWAIHWSFPAIVGLFIATFVIKEFLPFSQRWKRTINVWMAVLTVIVAMLFVYAIFRPLIGLTMDLQ